MSWTKTWGRTLARILLLKHTFKISPYSNTRHEASYAIRRIKDIPGLWEQLRALALELERPKCLAPIRRILSEAGLIIEQSLPIHADKDEVESFTVHSEHLAHAANESKSSVDSDDAFAIFAIFWAMEGARFKLGK